MPPKDKGRKVIEKHAVQLEQLKVDYIPVDTIKPNSYNPNRQSEHEFELLLRSMREDGFTQPIVCIRVTEATQSDPAFSGYQVGDVVIVDGEHRWRAARTIGWSEVPVVITDMTPEQMRIATLRHNRARGSEDIQLTSEVLRDLQKLGALDWAQDSLMLDDVEINRLLEDISAPDGIGDVPEFNPAWEPDKRFEHGTTTEAWEKTDSQGTAVTASSPGAVEATRELEKKLSEAKTAEERQMVRQDVDLVRISLLFNGDEAKLVKAVLGNEPAKNLLILAQNWVESGNTQTPAEARA